MIANPIDANHSASAADRDNELLKHMIDRLSVDELRARANALTGEELVTIVQKLNARQRRHVISAMSGESRGKLREAVRDAYVDFMAKLPRKRKPSILVQYLRAAPIMDQPVTIPAHWIAEQGELRDHSSYAYVLDAARYPAQRIALYDLAWSSLSVNNTITPHPIELALNIHTPLSAALLHMNLGGWDELPVGDEDPDSWEAFVGFEWEVIDMVHLFGEFYHDFDDVDGGFLELGIATEIPHPVEGLELVPYAMIGFDAGFVSGTRRLNENNVIIGLEAEFEVNDVTALFAGVHHSFALSNLDDEDEGDVTWFIAGASLAF